MLKRVIKETAVYGIGNALGRFCSLLIFPIYAKLLTQAEFAQQDLVLATAAVVSMIAGFGMENGYGRLFFDDDVKRTDLATTWGIFSLVTTIPIILGAIFYRETISLWLIKDSSAGELLIWGFGGIIFQILQRPSVLTLRMQRKAKRFVVVSLVGALSQLFLAVWFVRILEWGGVGVLRSYAAASVVSFIAAVIASGWIWGGQFSWKALRGMLAFGLPVLPAAVATWGLDSLNRFLLQHVSGPEETAVYGVGVKIVALLGIVFFGFQMAWSPFAYSLMKDPAHASKVYADVARWLWLVGGVAVFTLSLFSKELILLLTKEVYLPAASLVPMLGIAALLWSFFYIICIGYQYAKKMHHQMMAMFLGLAGLGLVGWMSIGTFGAVGAASATLVGYLIAITYASRASARYLAVPYPWSKIVLWASAVFILSCGLGGILPYSSSFALSFDNIFPLLVKIVCSLLLAGYGFWLLIEAEARAKVLRGLSEQVGRVRISSLRGQ